MSDTQEDVVEKLASVECDLIADGLSREAFFVGQAARELTSLRSQNKGMREALDLCEEFFDERADADQPAGCDSPIPNDEMTMLVKVRAALGDQS